MITRNHISCEDLGDGVFRLRMNDHANQNHLTGALCDGLVDALDELAANADVCALVLSGGPDVFCAGGSLDTLLGVSNGDFDVKDLLLPRRLVGFPLPVIAALRGHAVGGGLALALCCDILVASESKRYSANFMSMGFTPGMGTTSLLPALAGSQLAMEMMFTAKSYKGAELARRGLFAHAVADAEVEPLAEDLARQIADKPREALRILKETLAAPRIEALESAMRREHIMHRKCFSRPGMKARIEETYAT